jgi:hypothetical protein
MCLGRIWVMRLKVVLTRGRKATETGFSGAGELSSVGLFPRKIPDFLQPVKDDLGLKTPGEFPSPRKTHLSRCSIKTRVKEHHQHIRLKHPDESAIKSISRTR